jgi:hypothetical protein
MPGLDTIAEFKVETNNSSAKFTRPTTVVIATKSGTNAIHGNLFETHRNADIGLARRRQDGELAPHLIRNEFGANAGGPVYLPGLYNGKDRTFWYFAWEASREVRGGTEDWSVPTQAMRNGDFRELVDSQGREFNIYDPWSTDPVTWERNQFSHNGQFNVIDPTLISPLAQQLFDITPLPTELDVNPMLDDNWIGPEPYVRRDWTISTKFDHRFTDNDQVNLRYSQGDYYRISQAWSQPMLNNAPGLVRRLAPNKSGALTWVRTFSPTFFNEFLLSVSREYWWKGTGEPGVKYADEFGLPNPFDVIGWPGLYSTGLRNYHFETDNTQSSPFLFWIMSSNATKIAGKHELQFGFHGRLQHLNLLPDQQHPQGNHNWSTGATSLYDTKTSRTDPEALVRTGHNMGNFFIGSMNYSNQLVRGYFYSRDKEMAVYFQDNFKATPRLTLNLGLRWEYWPAMREKRWNMTSFDPDSRRVILANPLEDMYRLGATIPSVVSRVQELGVDFMSYQDAGMPRTLIDSNKANFGPRLGFAYRAGDGARSFILRGGFRISYFHIPARAWQARMRSNTPLTARFRTSETSAALSPDGIGNYGMRSVPTVIAGRDSRDAVTLDSVSGLNRGSPGASFFNTNRPDARVHDWNFTLEKEVMKNTVFRALYVGNHGSNLEQMYQMNETMRDWVWYMRTGEPKPGGEYSGVARRPWDQTTYGRVDEHRMTGWSNYHGAQFELERRYSEGYAFQVFWNIGNTLMAGGQQWSSTSRIYNVNNYLPGAVPTDIDDRNRLLNYRRDSGIPKHRVRWNWIVDLPFGRGKPLGRNVGGFLNRVIGGWQIAGMGNLRSNYFTLPSSMGSSGLWPTGAPVEIYDYKYPIQDCRPGRRCRPGYLWWNGYLPANQINSVDENGQPNGYMGVPSSYQPAVEPLIPWPADPDGDTRIAPDGEPLSDYFGRSDVWLTLNNGKLVRENLDLGQQLHPLQWQYARNNRTWGLDASLFKTIPINERVKVRFNADFFNVLNHPGNPTGVSSNGIKDVRNSGSSARQIQLTLRVTW